MILHFLAQRPPYNLHAMLAPHPARHLPVPLTGDEPQADRHRSVTHPVVVKIRRSPVRIDDDGDAETRTVLEHVVLVRSRRSVGMVGVTQNNIEAFTRIVRHLDAALPERTNYPVRLPVMVENEG
jgi:hypothetical protein